MAVAADLVAALVSGPPGGVTADGYDGDVADLDTTTRPASGAPRVRKRAGQRPARGPTHPVDRQQLSTAAYPAGEIDAATFDERCGVFTARRYANPGRRRLRPLTDTYTDPATGCLRNPARQLPTPGGAGAR
jgi:hypothetical protein